VWRCETNVEGMKGDGARLIYVFIYLYKERIRAEYIPYAAILVSLHNYIDCFCRIEPSLGIRTKDRSLARTIAM